MADGRQRRLFVECGSRFESGQVECLQDRGAAESIAGLGPREDGCSQRCGSRGVLKRETAGVSRRDIVVVLEGKRLFFFSVPKQMEGTCVYTQNAGREGATGMIKASVCTRKERQVCATKGQESVERFL